MEKFASVGGMLPEQVWDHDDLPALDLFKGKSAGSAQPLVWAHSEYLKLLKSAVDGQVFDCISTARERYAVESAKRGFTSSIEICKHVRPTKSMTAGQRLRLVDPARFRVIYTTDNWVTQATLESHPVGYVGFVCDIATEPDKAGRLILTLYWPGEDRWLGRNLEIAIAVS
jgi:glucoamylase